jgi:hypothetical protein
VRAFVQLRELLASHSELARRLDQLEGKLKHHDQAITAILSAIRELMDAPAPVRRGIGLRPKLTRKNFGEIYRRDAASPTLAAAILIDSRVAQQAFSTDRQQHAG